MLKSKRKRHSVKVKVKVKVKKLKPEKRPPTKVKKPAVMIRVEKATSNPLPGKNLCQAIALN